MALSLALSACGGTSSTSQSIMPAPTVTSFAPASGVAGTTVTITGTNLTGATAVTFGAMAASSFSVTSATTITAVVASGSTTGKIGVTTSGGTGSSSSTFAVTSPPAISSFSPTSGPAGISVVITGTNFTGATTVTFNGNSAATFTVNSATQITATVASGTTTGVIAVTTPAGKATSTTNFSVTEAPTISSFNPASGPVGTSVVLTGSNFTGATAVALNGTAPSSFAVNSATQITAVVASGTTSGKITVTTPGGTATSATNFSVTASAPTISSFNPGSGPVGTSVVIAGSNFTGATAVALNGKAASSFVVNSATQITAVVATGTTSGKITVSTPAGSATSASSFTVTSSNATLDLTIDGLYITQATQEYPNPQVPLVANRSAWVRVFAKANQANTVTPQVEVDFINGSTTNTLNIGAGSASVPLSIDPENAAASWNAAVPAAWMQAGTQVVATVDPTNAIPEANETNNTFTQTLDVRALKTWKVTLIPVHTADGNQGVVENGTRTRADWMDFAKRLHPVPDAIDVTVGSVFNTSVSTLQSDGTGWDTVLSALDAKRTADNVTDRYYYGAVHTTYNSGVAGMGYIGWPVAIGWDVNGSFPAVLAHEEGHNFNRQHSPCGGAGNPDPNYPYPGGLIGVPGWDVFASSGNLKPAATYTDVMGYCSTQWISDYVYVSELNFRQSSGLDVINSSSGSNVVPGQGLLVWGRIENGEVILEPAFQVPVKNAPPATGGYTWEAHDAAGRVIASVNFDAHEVADRPDTTSLRLFSFLVPLQTDVLAAVETMHIKLGVREIVRKTQFAPALSEADLQNTVRVEDLPDHGARVVWDATRYPVVMVRDAQTGEVRGFLRGGNTEIADAPKEIEVHVSGGIKSSILRHQRAGE